MALEEGFQRLRLLSRSALLLGALLFVVYFAIHIWLPITPLTSGFVAAGLLWVGGVYLVVLGAVGWAVGWVAEGFVRREP